MEELYKLETTSHYSFIYKVPAPAANIIHKIRIDISKSKDKNSRVFILKDYAWVLNIEENYWFNNSVQQNNMCSAEEIFNKKIQYYLELIYKLLYY